MGITPQTNLRLDEETKRMLRELAKITDRTSSAVMRHLIRKEYKQLVGDQCAAEEVTDIKHSSNSKK